jgi:hypothetical protein
MAVKKTVSPITRQQRK